jgi:hypothetical protein
MTQSINPLERIRELQATGRRSGAIACVLGSICVRTLQIGGKEDMPAITAGGLLAFVLTAIYALESTDCYGKARNIRDDLLRSYAGEID